MTERPALLLLLARWPRHGRVKTRLAAEIGDEAALHLHRAMVADGRDRLRRMSARGWRVGLLWADGPDLSPPLRARLTRRSGEELQRGADLGQRMAAALEDGLARGNGPCLLIGADSPTLPDDRLEKARRALERADVVFGPADDGGYYLVGAIGRAPAVFDGLPWGTGAVLERSLAAAREHHLETALLPPHYDIDRPDDLDRLRRELAEDDAAAALARHTRRALREAAR